MSNPTSQAIEKAQDKPDAMIAQYRDDFAQVLPSHIKADQWVRTAQGIVRRNPKLLAAAKGNPGSFMAAMLRCAHLGLEPGDTFHLVPYGKEIKGITDYKGEIELMYRAGEVVSVKAEIVYAGDVFEWDPGAMGRPTHTPPLGPNGRPDWFAERGEMVGAYAYADMRTGAVSKVVVMGKAEIMKHRELSQNKALWDKWPISAWLKTVVKELSKWTPTSPEYRSEVLRQEAALTVVAESHPDLPPVVEDDDPGRPFTDDDITDAEVVE